MRDGAWAVLPLHFYTLLLFYGYSLFGADGEALFALDFDFDA